MIVAVSSLTEHQLLIFWLQLLVLVAVARGLGALMRRIGQPAVVGELAAGLALGPSLLGRVLPGVHDYLFPADPVQNGLLMAVAWIGVALLLVITGFETDLALLRRLGRSSAYVATGSLVVPLVLGFGVGQLLPAVFIGESGARLTFALFMAVALSISSLPVIAKILMELGLMRRNIGQVIVAAGMANDLVGWMLLGTVAGIVTSGSLDVISLVITVALIMVFLVLALTGGQRLVDAGLRRTSSGGEDLTSAFGVVILATLFIGVITQALGIEAVLGAFVAGILVGRSRYFRHEIARPLETVVTTLFAPVFFATAGLSVDLWLLGDPRTALWAVVVIAVAAIAKLGGAYAGARLGGMSSLEGLAIGVGLNARGAVEVVIATIGLSLGVLNQLSYSIVVIMAMATSISAPPLLRRVLSRHEAEPEEAARLEREAILGRSVVAGTRNALLPTRGGANSLLAAQLLDLSLQPSTEVTVLTVSTSKDGAAQDSGEAAAREVAAVFERRPVARRTRIADDPAAAIRSEAEVGYGLMALGLTESFTGGHGLSETLQVLLADSPVPILLVKHGAKLDPHVVQLPLRRVLVPSIDTHHGLAAQEIAFTLAAHVDAHVDVVHIIDRPDQPEPVMAAHDDGAHGSAAAMLESTGALAAGFGASVTAWSRTGVGTGPGLCAAADERQSDLIVLGGRVRSLNDQPFFGHGVEYVLEHAHQTVMLVVLPEEKA